MAKTVKKSEPLASIDPLKNNMYVLLGVGLVIGFIIGHLYTQVTFLKKGAGGTAPTAAGTGQPGDQAAPEAPKKISIAKPDPAKDHWKGSKDARYVHVEYSDFECPFCKRYFDSMGQIEKAYGDKMAFVYRHFPLSFHPKAEPAARASECVASLGGASAFWKMHDEIFNAMPTMEVTQLGDLAQKSGVNKAAFQTCLDGGQFKDKVQAQLDEGTKAGIAATPTSVIYDMKTGETAVIEGALPFDSAKQIIDGLISKGS
ncbi:MAG: Disulfide bond formation protein D precursor [Microgenomates bacterium OLB23]|nr:MAG: Disulfide bond formation protein D precursor [Microgenomates bacterium OLB23]